MAATTARACEFCGRELRPRVLPSLFGLKPMTLGFEECDCPEARKRREEEEREEEERRRMAEGEAFCRRLDKAGVPRRYFKAQHPMAKELADKVEGGASLYVWGDNGTLKTTLASAIARRLVCHGLRVLMVNSIDLLIEIQSTYGTPKSEADVLDRYYKAPVLVIDDLGKEQQTAWTVSRLYSIVNARYGAMLPTVITSNFKVSDLAERMAGSDQSTARAIASRLAGSCEQIATGGGDRRLS